MSPVSDTLREQQAIHAKCMHPAGTFTPFRLKEIEQSVGDRFEQTVLRYPGHVAVRQKNRQLTYDELNKTANRIANAVLSRRGEGQEPIALLIEKNAQLIGAILGVLKAGKTYVPLDVHVPDARLAYVLQDSQSVLLVTNDRNLSRARELAKDAVPLVNADQLETGIADENPGLPVAPDTLAYILYTSGSTGQPKGVVENHRNILLEAMRVTNKFQICPEDRVALRQSCSFSGSVRKLYPGLLNGASIHPIDAKEESAHEIARRLVEEEITVMARIGGLQDGLTGVVQFPKLRLVISGGQTIYKRDIEFWWKLLPPEAVQAIGYSITEAGSVSHYFIDRQSELATTVVPVGYATEEAEILLLDDEGDEVGCGEVGEIVVRSRYMSPGYWHRPDLTETAFVPTGGGRRLYRTGDLGRRSPDGCLNHLGRKDSQVKIRGYRVELLETQAALMDLDTVKQTFVKAHEDSLGDRRLVAYVVPAAQPAPTASVIRRRLAEKLPDYMIPSTFVFLEEMPLTATGKVDPHALPAPESVRPELDSSFVAPRTPEETWLADLWAEVLGLDRVGVYDNFLDLGGDSLLAGKLVARIEAFTGLHIPLATFFGEQTVEQLAAGLPDGFRDRMNPSRSSITTSDI